MCEKLIAWCDGTRAGKWYWGTSPSKWIAAALALGTLAICFAITSWALYYQRTAGTENPSAADWLQGWGTIFGLIATSIAAVAAAAVYIESRRAAELAERRRLEDRIEADRAIHQAESRRLEDRAEAEQTAKATDRRWQEQMAYTRQDSQLAVVQLQEERKERARQIQEAKLQAPRAVLVTRIGPGMQGRGKLAQVAVGVQNFGTQPIRRVSALVRVRATHEAFGVRIPLLGPGEARTSAWNCAHGQAVDVPVDEAPVWDLDTDPVFWSVTLNFIDATGLAWNRDDNGEPYEVPTAELPE